LQLGIGIWNRLIFYVAMLKKAIKDFGCKLLTIVMHDFLGLSINHNPQQLVIGQRRLLRGQSGKF
jgi:hypothetical protein